MKYKKHCMLLKQSNTSMLSRDSIITGLLQFNVWKKFFMPMNSQNKNEGGDQVEHLLRQAKNSLYPASVIHLIILCGTNSILKVSPKYISDNILWKICWYENQYMWFDFKRWLLIWSTFANCILIKNIYKVLKHWWSKLSFS